MLELLYYKQKILSAFKIELINLGHINQIHWLNGQLDLLDELIKIESINVLDELLRKTNYRLLKGIEKGTHNLVDIINNPKDWYLGKINDNHDEWNNNDCLIFSTERFDLLFSKNPNLIGQKYDNNKWQ